MKSLKPQGHPSQEPASNEQILATRTTSTEADAIEAKMKSIEPKLFGIKLVNYTMGQRRKVWVPYYFMEYEYVIKKGLVLREHGFQKRTGNVAVVYDANEMHASHYDLIAEGEIPLQKKFRTDMDGEIISDSESFDTLLENAERSIQRQILFKAYKMEGELTLLRYKKFYREAWELQVFYKDREFIKYAYLDDYGVKNERARGLRARMDNV